MTILLQHAFRQNFPRGKNGNTELIIDCQSYKQVMVLDFQEEEGSEDPHK